MQYKMDIMLYDIQNPSNFLNLKYTVIIKHHGTTVPKRYTQHYYSKIQTLKLTIAKSFNISQPKPPAPTTKTLACVNGSRAFAFALPTRSWIGSNSPLGKAPVSLPKGEGRDKSVKRSPRSLFEWLLSYL